jgi:pyruvate dehydrogenase E1 component alpha subunit
MAEEVLATFTIRRLAVLDEHGVADEALLPELSGDQLLRMHELMVLARTFDERALALQREGRLGTYPPITGQEAAQVGSAFALDPADRVFPSFREIGVHLTLGYPIDRLYQYWAGDERGQCAPEGVNIFPVCVSVGTHIPHAVGAAVAARYRKEPAVAVAYFGDGATSKGDFHEGLNMAGVFRLPALFICQNNQWAISVPLKQQTAAASLAQKAIAYGIEGIQVDGNDVLAVYRATREALERARSGGGPTFIECLTYRMADHTTADDAARYRPPEAVEAWKKRDPILRLERYLTDRGLLDDGKIQDVRKQAVDSIDAAVAAMEAIPPALPSEMFDHTCATLGQRQAARRKEA